MTNQHELQELVSFEESAHPEWNEQVVCRVEVDLAGWLTQLTGGKQWEVDSEREDENCISFSMREKTAKKGAETAEITLYHSGYAVVEVGGRSLFDGELTAGTTDWASLSYYHADSGEPVTLN